MSKTPSVLSDPSIVDEPERTGPKSGGVAPVGALPKARAAGAAGIARNRRRCAVASRPDHSPQAACPIRVCKERYFKPVFVCDN